MIRSQKVLVLGAGYSGLSAAYQLAKRGHKVTVLEAKGVLGGRAHSFTEKKTGDVTDNGQHAFMGCYEKTLELIRELGVEDRLLEYKTLEIPFLSERGESLLKAAYLPSPFHLFYAFLNFKEMGWRDKMSACGLCIRLLMGQRPIEGETAKEWFERWNQTPNAVRGMWEVICVGFLNEPIATASASVFANVVRYALLGPPSSSRLILSRVGMSDLFAPELERALGEMGGTIERNRVVKELRFNKDKLTEVVVEGGNVFKADHVVSALTWNVLRGLLPESGLLTACKSLQDCSTINIHLWLDRPIMSQTFVGFLGSSLNWIFNRNAIENKNKTSLYRYSVVIGGSNAWLESSNADLEAMTMKELHRMLPLSREAKVEHSLVYKWRASNYSVTPDAEKYRPQPQTEWKNFWLAGDWTAVGLPPGIEGAVLSGHRVAELITKTAMV